MNKLLIYQIVVLVILYIGYGFFYYTRKSISFMLPHLDQAAQMKKNAMNDSTNSADEFASGNSISFQLSKQDIGMIVSLLNVAYAISKFFSGILSDVLSVRLLFGGSLFMSGLLNVYLRKDVDIYSVYCISFLIGLAQGPAWPCCSKLIQNWMPKEQFGTWWAVLSTSANLAGALGPVLATWLALKYHWTYGFLIPGCIAMCMAYLAVICIRNSPADVGLRNPNGKNTNQKKVNSSGISSCKSTDHTYADLHNPRNSVDHLPKYRINKLFRRKDANEEKKLTTETVEEKGISSDSEKSFDNNDNNDSSYEEDQSKIEDEIGCWTEPTRSERVKQLFTYSFFLAVCVAYFLAQLVKTLVSDWTQIYLIKTHQVNPYSASYFVSAFELSGMFGCIFSGIFTDLWVARTTRAKTSPLTNDAHQALSTRLRMHLVTCYMFALALALHLFNTQLTGAQTSDSFLVVLGSTLGFACHGAIALLGVAATNFTSASLSGTSHAIASLAANCGAILAGVPFGVVSEMFSWQWAFAGVECLTMSVALLLALVIGNSKSKFEENDFNAMSKMSKYRKIK